MRVAFIVSETFTEKRHGGFGWLVRLIARELTRRGLETIVITWRDPGYPEKYVVNNSIKVLAYTYHYETKSVIRHLLDYKEAYRIIKDASADIYISFEAMVETLLAKISMKDSKHIVWAQDPFDWNDYELLASVDPHYKISKLRFYVNRLVFGLAYRYADQIFVQAKFYVNKLRNIYRVDPSRIRYLPNPVHPIPDESKIKKSEEPLVCYLGRMDPQKRYWIFFELAKCFPKIKFVAMGKPSILYKDLYEKVVERYANLDNLKILGFVSEERKREILSRCWVLCLPSIREGLPVAFLEALAHKCALLSSVNPDNIVEKFGCYVKDGNFARCLRELIDEDTWREKGELGYHYVRRVHLLETIMNKLSRELYRIAGRANTR